MYAQGRRGAKYAWFYCPAAVTGHETVYEWRCTDGSPTIVRQVLEVDEEGYPVNFWYEIQPN
ncbi:hypothetical protein RY27_11640 [Litorilinea aerophila]|nr:hypothetical protein RY27_11640 [Litorilinea aerophila]